MEQIVDISTTDLGENSGKKYTNIETIPGIVRKVKLRDHSFQAIKNKITPVAVKQEEKPIQGKVKENENITPMNQIASINVLSGETLLSGKVSSSNNPKGIRVQLDVRNKISIFGNQQAKPEHTIAMPVVEEVRIVTPSVTEIAKTEKVGEATVTPAPTIEENSIPTPAVVEVPKEVVENEDANMKEEAVVSDENVVQPEVEESAMDIADSNTAYQEVIEQQKNVIVLKKAYNDSTTAAQKSKEVADQTTLEKSESEKDVQGAIQAKKEAVIEFQAAIRNQRLFLEEQAKKLAAEKTAADEARKVNERQAEENREATKKNHQTTAALRAEVESLQKMKAALLLGGMDTAESKETGKGRRVA